VARQDAFGRLSVVAPLSVTPFQPAFKNIFVANERSALADHRLCVEVTTLVVFHWTAL
jgi:hypothetical protein